MDFIRKLINRIFAPSKPLDQWYEVKVDDEGVYISAEPHGRKPWSQQFRWDEVERVCFKAEGVDLSDGIYVFTSRRPESFVIPTEAKGGLEFWSEIIDRELFDAELAIEAASASSGIFCWPEE